MKNLFKLILLALIAMMGCKTENKNELEGAWKMIYVGTMLKDSLIGEWHPSANAEDSQIKMWTATHFAFAGNSVSDTALVLNAGGGTYTLNGNQYEENILYHTAPTYRNTKLKLTLEIKNDTLSQKYKVNFEGKDYVSEERYIKME
jgi:hypothetical protein